MTPKEFDFLCQMVEATAIEAYRRGHTDGGTSKPLNLDVFKLSKGARLTLKTKLEQHVKTR